MQWINFNCFFFLFFLFSPLLSVSCFKLNCLCFSAVSVNLEESLASSAKATLQAIGAQEAAVQAITRHTYKLKAAMEAEVHTTSQGGG